MKQKGFTLIEILIVLAIMGLVLSLGMTVDLNSLKDDNFQTEQTKIISILERARSQAMANLYDKNHGFCYIAPNYIIFSGDTCTENGSELIPANTNIASHTGTTFPEKIVFQRITGNTTAVNLHISDSLYVKDIEINDEGTINW